MSVVVRTRQRPLWQRARTEGLVNKTTNWLWGLLKVPAPVKVAIALDVVGGRGSIEIKPHQLCPQIGISSWVIQRDRRKTPRLLCSDGVNKLA